jgi:hypothetical protein
VGDGKHIYFSLPDPENKFLEILKVVILIASWITKIKIHHMRHIV